MENNGGQGTRPILNTGQHSPGYTPPMTVEFLGTTSTLEESQRSLNQDAWVQYELYRRNFIPNGTDIPHQTQMTTSSFDNPAKQYETYIRSFMQNGTDISSQAQMTNTSFADPENQYGAFASPPRIAFEAATENDSSGLQQMFGGSQGFRGPSMQGHSDLAQKGSVDVIDGSSGIQNSFSPSSIDPRLLFPVGPSMAVPNDGNAASGSWFAPPSQDFSQAGSAHYPAELQRVPSNPKTTMGTCSRVVPLSVGPRNNPNRNQRETVELDPGLPLSYVTRAFADRRSLSLLPVPQEKQRPLLFKKFGVLQFKRFVRIRIDGCDGTSLPVGSPTVYLNVGLIEPSRGMGNCSIALSKAPIQKLGLSHITEVGMNNFYSPDSPEKDTDNSMHPHGSATMAARSPPSFLVPGPSNESPQISTPGGAEVGVGQFSLSAPQGAVGEVSRMYLAPATPRHQRRLTASTAFRSDPDSFRFSLSSPSTAPTSQAPSVINTPALDDGDSRRIGRDPFMDYGSENSEFGSSNSKFYPTN